jgi:hypothetical protein
MNNEQIKIMPNKAKFQNAGNNLNPLYDKELQEKFEVSTDEKQSQTKPILPAYMAGKIALSAVEGPIVTILSRAQSPALSLSNGRDLLKQLSVSGWQVKDSFTSGALDFVGFVVGGDFEFQAADAGQEYKRVELSHNIADLPHLGLAALLGFGLLTCLPQGNVLFGQGGGGDDCFAVRYITVGVGIILERYAAAHTAKDSYSFGNRRVRAGQVGQLHRVRFLEGIDDIHRRGNFISGGQLRGRVSGDFFKRTGQAFGVAREARCACVGEVFAPSGKGEIKQLCHYRGQYRGDNCDDQHNNGGLSASSAAGGVSSPGTAHRAVKHTPQKNLREQDNRAEHYAGQRNVKYIAVKDVADFVGDDALQLIAIEPAEQSRGHGHRGGLRASACGEGVGGGVGYDVDFGHRGQTCGDFHLLDDVE